MTINALLIDDDPDTRALVALSLDRHPEFAVTAVSRLDAAAMLRRGVERLDVILLDLKMNDMSAQALVATMRKWSPAPVPILLMSGKAGDADRRTYRSAGAQGVIAKPFDPVALPDRVVEMMAPDPVAHGRAAGAR